MRLWRRSNEGSKNSRAVGTVVGGGGEWEVGGREWHLVLAME